MEIVQIPTNGPVVSRTRMVEPQWYRFLKSISDRLCRLVDVGAPGVIKVTTVGDHQVAWATAAPTAGTWEQGDVVWKSDATVGQPNGWRCTASGVPGTWVAMSNL